MQVTIHPGLSVEPVVHIPFSEDPLYLRIIAVGSFCYIHPGFQCTVHGEIVIIDHVCHFPGSPVCYLQNFIFDDTYSAITIPDNAAVVLLMPILSDRVFHHLEHFILIGDDRIVLNLPLGLLLLFPDRFLKCLPVHSGFFGVEIKCG